MLSLLNPVAPFYTFMQNLWLCFPLAARLLITLCFGIMLVFAVMKSVSNK